VQVDSVPVCKAYCLYYVVIPAVRRRLVILTKSQMTFGQITKLQLTRDYSLID
jgi:hypothetical protein